MRDLLVRCLFLLTVLVPVVSADTPSLIVDSAPGYGELGYELPDIGSYNLPSLGQATDGMVLDTQGRKQHLFNLFGSDYVLLAFIYSTCSDVNGCPLTSHVFYKIKSAMKQDQALAGNLKLISLSFDPEIDTPEVMTLYSNNFRYAGNAGDWRFITTASQTDLNPILAAYNQDIQREVDSEGNPLVGYSHVLRVFLIDPEKQIRNIYSVDFLHHDL
ncbi:MAG: SCO family protein, partial [Candidatus Thiodiazotropha sp. (ex Myrtea spinifera)]|nr:SCO family protein [Candidatus Thiodiazotropha sp. (ex Myrtea spinifera)]